MLCKRQANSHTFWTLQLTVISYRRIALTNGIHVRSVKRCARLYARRSSRRDLGAVYWSRFFEMLEILPCFRIVEGDCLFDPNPGKVDVPLQSRSIEIKHSKF